VSRCTYCNGHPHDASAHAETCGNGHPLDIVGRYANGRCRACQRALVRARYWRDPEGHRARNRAYKRRMRASRESHGREAVGSSTGAGAPPLGRTPAPALVVIEDQGRPLAWASR
jgi:hypothetical protein